VLGKTLLELLVPQSGFGQSKEMKSNQSPVVGLEITLYNKKNNSLLNV